MPASCVDLVSRIIHRWWQGRARNWPFLNGYHDVQDKTPSANQRLGRPEDKWAGVTGEDKQGREGEGRGEEGEGEVCMICQ